MKDPNTAPKPSFFEKIATVVVDRRNLIFFLYIGALIFSLFSSSWVKVCNDITEYLPPETETRRGLTIMDEEFTTFGTARVMVSNITYDKALELQEQLEAIEGVSEVTFDETDEHFKNTSALFDITFHAEEDEALAIDAMNAVKEQLAGYDTYVKSTVGSSDSETLAEEMNLILLIAAVIIVLVLLFTSRTYAEIPVLIMTFGTAALLNKGTNFFFDEISFVSNSVTVVLQLALAIDYAIILLHRFTEEKATKPTREAAISALSQAIPEISASSLTTISGLVAMMFMQFRLGFDMGMVLVKAILLSLITVFTLMPGLLMLFSNLIEKSAHKSFVPKIDKWGKVVVFTRYIVPPVFVLVIVGAFFLSNNCPYVYGFTLVDTERKNETQIAEEKIEDTFGKQNLLALIVPSGNYDAEKSILQELEKRDEVDHTLGLANTEAMDGYLLTDKLTPREFSEMTDIDYELVCAVYAAYAVDDENYGKLASGISSYSVPLIDMFLFICEQKDKGIITLDDDELNDDLDTLYDKLLDAKAQLQSDTYTRMLVYLTLPEEGEETFAFLRTIHSIAEKYYPADSVILAGDAENDYDLSASFVNDNIMISILSAVFVIIVLLFTFQSVGLPVLLIAVIQGSIWINFSFPTVTSSPIYFLGYLIVSSIQMGANIDYAIVISSRYMELKNSLPPRKAIVEALNLAFPTIVTSGTILAAAGILIAMLSTNAVIAGIGSNLGRGTVISMFLVMGVLPQILLLGDIIIEKTKFSLPLPEVTKSTTGTVFVSGRVRGRVSGFVDANITGVIRGDVNAIVEAGNIRQTEEAESPQALPGPEDPSDVKPDADGKEKTNDETPNK